MSNILVTGGAGFIGSNLAEVLSKEHNVKIIDNFSTGKKENLDGLNVTLVEGDIRDLAFLYKHFNDIDYVFHEAALPSLWRSINSPYTTMEINTMGTLNVLTASRDFGVRKVIYAGSSSAYGNRASEHTYLKIPIPPNYEYFKSQPKSPYAVSKLSGEQLCKVYSNIFDLPTICLRYFNVFGKRQANDSPYSGVIAKFIKAFLGNKPITIYGDGLQTRDFTFIDNVIEANISAMDSDLIHGETINIACGESHSVLELVQLLEKISGKKVDVEFTDAKPIEIRHSLADLTKAKQLLGYVPKTMFAEGLEKTYGWYESIWRKEQE
jgi:nucleoside-diphosphate-sugar epimerase